LFDAGGNFGDPVESVTSAGAVHPLRHDAHRFKVLGGQGFLHRHDFILAVGQEFRHKRFEGGIDVHEFFVLSNYPFKLRVFHECFLDQPGIGRFSMILDRDA